MKKNGLIVMGLVVITILMTSIAPKSNIRFWGANGHRITGQIGELNLTQDALKKVREISKGHSFAYLATWPDEVRSDKKWDFMKNLHFLSVDDTETLENVLAKTKKDTFPTNVVEAIHFFKGILLKDVNKRNAFEKMINKDTASFHGLDSIEEIALAYLIHFVGDVHQPMHVGRTYDLGGNKVAVEFFGEHSNLHSVWDEGIIEQQDLSFSEYSQFLNHAPADSINKWQNHNPDEWAQESIDIRLKIYQQTYFKTDFTSGLPVLSYEYPFAMKPILDERLLKGGIRLAGTINQIFK
ncbi:S1/P1 nuclease [Algoriphagus sp.]|uniref:S1/P1 nuclease n=1 Tax=Algoriphagus sp. TaxID=1872435 RepID=UPI0025F2B05E|nr:S1/P1 nuclease [Algoriphagus sp.]